ncbi:MAG: sulfate ABC transporter permease subunit CysT [Rickettsiales bacterium]|jgi:sulfate transport system permease protein|nr:sulfate ABC transporter permease subunit CysT [Rickettsiales bacterium]
MLYKKYSILPFFKISLAYTLFYLLLLVVLPISHLFYQSIHLSWEQFFVSVFNDRVIAAYQLTIASAFIASLINVLMGLIIAWSMVRYNFRGKPIIDAFIDLPLALPTAIAGLSLANLYDSESWFGKFLANLGIEVIFTNLGIIVALIFVGLPLAIRTIEPVVREIDEDIEAAAYSLGASPWKVFCKIYLPNFLPSIFSAFSLSFARGLSEYGAIIFIASNIPKESEIISLLIYSKIEQFDYNQATAIAAVMMIMAFSILWGINLVTKRCRHEIC